MLASVASTITAAGRKLAGKSTGKVQPVTLAEFPRPTSIFSDAEYAEVDRKLTGLREQAVAIQAQLDEFQRKLNELSLPQPSDNTDGKILWQSGQMPATAKAQIEEIQVKYAPLAEQLRLIKQASEIGENEAQQIRSRLAGEFLASVREWRTSLGKEAAACAKRLADLARLDAAFRSTARAYFQLPYDPCRVIVPKPPNQLLTDLGEQGFIPSPEEMAAFVPGTAK